MELAIEDLVAKCPRCKGTKNEPEVGSMSTGGFGRTPVATYSMPNTCQACGGGGYLILTPAGKVLKEFIELVNLGRVQ